jgi:hypothetical protein
MTMRDVPDLLVKAVKCYSEGDFQKAIRFISESELIIRLVAEQLRLPISLDYSANLHFEILLSMQFEVSKETLRKELIFDIERLARLSNPPKVEVSKWMVWCMNDYVSITGKSCKQFTEFKRSYLKSISQKSI